MLVVCSGAFYWHSYLTDTMYVVVVGTDVIMTANVYNANGFYIYCFCCIYCF